MITSHKNIQELLNQENSKKQALAMVSFRYDKKKLALVRRFAKKHKVSMQDLLSALVDDLIDSQKIE